MSLLLQFQHEYDGHLKQVFDWICRADITDGIDHRSNPFILEEGEYFIHIFDWIAGARQLIAVEIYKDHELCDYNGIPGFMYFIDGLANHIVHYQYGDSLVHHDDKPAMMRLSLAEYTTYHYGEQIVSGRLK